MTSEILAAGDGALAARPLRLGDIPPLADCFSVRPETGPGPADVLMPGQTLLLTAPPGVAGVEATGAGKTQYAAFLAETLWQARKVDLLLWVTASSRASVLTSYAQALQAVTRHAGSGPAEALASRFASWLSETGRPWLVVLDDVTGSLDLDGLWPQGPFGRTVITTRDAGAVTPPWRPPGFPIGDFSPHEALSYLAGRLSADPDQRVGAVDLLEVVGFEPLALMQATATIMASSLTCRDYREMFTRRKLELADSAGADLPGTAVTWTLAAEQAARLSPAAQSCLALAALMDPQGMPGRLFGAPAVREYLAARHGDGWAEPARAQSALASLERVGLLAIDRGSAARTVRVHRSVQARVISAMPESMRAAAVAAVAGALSQSWASEDSEPWVANALRGCVTGLERAAGLSLWAAGHHTVLLQAGESLDAARATGPAVDWWRSLVASADQFLGPGHPDAARAAEGLARACLVAGLGDDAVALYQRTYDLRSGVMGADDPGAIAAGADLGRALLAAGRAKEAMAAFEATLRAAGGAGDVSLLDLLTVEDNLAVACQVAGQLNRAIELSERTLADRTQRQGSGHPDTLATRARLARLLLADGGSEEAAEHGTQALAGRERTLGPDHPDTLKAMVTLASCHHAGQRLKKAIALYERALREQERTLGPDHQDTLVTRGNLASAYHSAGRMAKALPLYEQARADCVRVLGAEHPDTLVAQANLAHAYEALGRTAAASALLKDTLATCARALPLDDPLTAAVRESLETLSRQ